MNARAKRVVLPAREWRARGVPLPWFVPDETLIADARVLAVGAIAWANAWPGEERTDPGEEAN